MAKAAIRKEYSDYASLQRLQIQKNDELQRISTQSTFQEKQASLHRNKQRLAVSVPPLFTEHSTLLKETFDLMHLLVKDTLCTCQVTANVQQLQNTIAELEENLEQYRMDFTRGISNCSL